MQTDFTSAFGDGNYRFHLGMRQIVAIEEKCNAGIGEVFSRVLRGRYADKLGETIGVSSEGVWRVLDLTEVIRQGLIGGGSGEADGQPVVVTPVIATQLVETYVEGRPFSEAWAIAAAILTARIEGYEAPGKQPDVPKKKARDRSGSTGRKSSPTAR